MLSLATGARGEDAPARAVELHNHARELYAAGRYRDAIARLDEAVGLDPNASILFFNLGLIHEQLGQIERAVTNYQRSLELETNPTERDNLGATLKRLEGVKKTGDLVPPPSRPTAPIDRPRPSGRHPLRPWLWVSVGTAAGLTVLGAAFAARAMTLQRSAERPTGDGVAVDQLESDARQARTSAIVSDVSFALAGTSAVAGIVLAVVATRERSETARAKREAASEVGMVPTISLGLVGGCTGELSWRF
jgi:tetratricopeptide (TPR) repeat protein